MLVGHSAPQGVTWSFTATATGAAIVTASALLTDDRPDTVTRCKWPSGLQTTASRFNLLADWSTPLVPGLVGLSNVSLPVGTKVEVTFRRTGDAMGTYPYSPAGQNNPQRVVAGPRGERTIWVLFDAGATAVVGAAIKIYNDVDGVASIVASSYFDIGEARICVVDDIDIEDGWRDETVDDMTAKFARTRQLDPSAPSIYRELTFRIPADEQSFYFGALTDLFAKLDRGRAAVWVPRHVDEDGVFSATMLHRTARIGIATKLPRSDHDSGPYFESQDVAVVEWPIPT